MSVYVLDTVRFNKHERLNVLKCADGAKSRALALSMRTTHRHGHSINSPEDRTPHEPSSVICMRLAARTTYCDSSLCDSDSLCSTVATSCELVATVDHDGHRINSAGARTPHEPSLLVLMRFAYSGCAAAITLTSAHWQRVGRRPGPPLNGVRSAAEAGACAEKLHSRIPCDFALGCHKVEDLAASCTYANRS